MKKIVAVFALFFATLGAAHADEKFDTTAACYASPFYAVTIDENGIGCNL